MTKLIIFILCFSMATTQQRGGSPANNRGYSPNEIQRQNRITQRIIANFLERKLFPYRRPQHQVPTIDEILPLTTEQPRRSYLHRQRTALELFNKIKNYKSEEYQDQEDEEQEEGGTGGGDSEPSAKAVDDYYDDGGNIQEDDYFNSNSDFNDNNSNNNEDNYNQSISLRTGRAGDGSSRSSISALFDDYPGFEDSNSNYDSESLQSVESEHLDSFYRSQKHKLYHLDADFFEDCPNCVDDQQGTPNRWTMPLMKLGEKRYYLGVFFKANWYRAAQYCRFHGMHLASISSQEENDRLEKHIRDFGFGNEHFWTSGTDLADEGNFFWMANGRPITFTNWNAGEPNNFRYENGEEENCLELWNRDGKGLKWNDSPCSFETFFVCEVQ